VHRQVAIVDRRELRARSRRLEVLSGDERPDNPFRRRDVIARLHPQPRLGSLPRRLKRKLETLDGRIPHDVIILIARQNGLKRHQSTLRDRPALL
jgi:hypothetical protein